MCGICGIINRKDNPSPQPSLIEGMISMLHHRGPDAAGYYRDNHACLGQSRLSIIDLESGSQPMADMDERLWLVFNGEIYNYLELKAELTALGYGFRTKSDTEVIIQAYREWGTDCFNKFNGQWALALWDPKEKELMLSRDRMGIRPLYYTTANNRFCFASEVKALFTLPEISREFDPKGIAQTFTFWSPVDPVTVFKGVYQLPAGNFAVLKKGQLSTKPYWQPEFPIKGSEKNQDLKQNTERLRELLIDAAKLRFTRSDVPVGAYLSGGIDSSITAGIITRYTDTPLKTFSIRFKDSEFDEGSYQKEMVSRLGTDHESIAVGYGDIGTVFPDVIWHTERPILRTAPAPLYLLSRLVRESGYKVVVTGEGSDEVLGGYDLFKELKARMMLYRHPDSPIKERIFSHLYPWMERSPVKNPAFAAMFLGKGFDLDDLGVSHRSRWDGGGRLLKMLDPAFMDGTLPAIDTKLLNTLPEGASQWDSLSLAQYLEFVTLLSGYILSAQGDRMLMANSVEGRFPFLDYRLVDFADSIPARHKILFLDEKYILKKAFPDIIPESILQRPKQPYRAPDAASFFQGEPDWVSYVTSEDLINKAGIFQYDIVTKIAAKCRNRGGMNMSNTDNMRITSVLSTMLVYDQFIRNPPRSTGLSGNHENCMVIDKTTNI